MATIGSLIVNLIANTAGFSSGMQKGVKDAKAFEARMKMVSGVVSKFAGALGIAGAGFSAGHFLRGAIDEAIEAENVFKRLDTAVKSTGAVAGFTARQLSDMAEDLQKTTTFADDTTKAAQALLLTFTNVKGDVFPAAIKAAQDMSIALGVDLNDAVKTVGKSLNDPSRGLALLTKAGATFTKEQRSIIATSKETGNALRAQHTVLDVLTKMYGGQAAAALETTAGKLAKLRNEWNDFKESVGQGVGLPVLEVLNKGIEKYKNSVYGPIYKFILENYDPNSGPAMFGSSSGGKHTPIPSGNSSGQVDSIAKKFADAYNAPWKKTGFLDFFTAEKNKALDVRDAMDIQKRFGLPIGMAIGLGVMGAGGMGKEDWLTRGAKPISAPVKMSSALATSFERGSVGDYLARNESKGGATFIEVAKKQLTQQERIALAVEKWDPFGGQPFPTTVTIGGA